MEYLLKVRSYHLVSLLLISFAKKLHLMTIKICPLKQLLNQKINDYTK